ncbi:hypothetical protein ACFXK0_15375 [Nocardia sp. NPDC059177]|uniref:globin domain-containing protein n=1 Tax=Nocardia sp. NPDC059177 TaxID=3346759 RepID=UPI00368D583B
MSIGAGCKVLAWQVRISARQEGPMTEEIRTAEGEVTGLRSVGITRVDGKTMLEHAGGPVKIRELSELFHTAVLEDDLLHDMFARGSRHHAVHLAHFLEEIMGGRQRYTDLHDGVAGLFEAHRDLRITEDQRRRFVEIMISVLDIVDFPRDSRLRAGFSARLEQGSHFSKNLSQVGAEPLDPWPPVGTWDW